MNCLTEIVNNIKIIKLNSYCEEFQKKLLGKRWEEIKAYLYRTVVLMINWSAAVMIPPYILLTCFSIYLAHGYKMSVSDAFAAIYLIDMLRGPIRWLPMFIGELMQFLVSMKRI